MKEIYHARSSKEGIVFYSNTIPDIGIKTYFDESGNIRFRLVNSNKEDLKEFLEAIEKKDNSPLFLAIFNTSLISFSIIFSILTKNFWFILGTLYYVLFVSRYLFRFVENIFTMNKKNINNSSAAKFHAAEHMVTNCYRKLQRVPTITELKKYSQFEKDCGSKELINKIFLYTAMSIAISFQSWYSPYVYACILTVIFLFAVLNKKFNLLRFMQVFITDTPSDFELKLAIEGLKKFEELETYLNDGNSPISYFFLPDDTN